MSLRVGVCEPMACWSTGGGGGSGGGMRFDFSFFAALKGMVFSNSARVSSMIPSGLGELGLGLFPGGGVGGFE